ncbi:MAG: CoA-binding protein [Clostridia bacterium]|nr:CoA-binding protein [Clostridia bacterium]
MEDLIKEFMAQKRFAVVGATDNPEKYGNKIFHNLRRRGYEVYPVNPKLEQLDGTKCYPNLAAIPVKVDVVDIVVPPKSAEEVIKEAKELGIQRIWLQPGAESEAAIKFCQENGLKCVYNTCVMMH